MSEFGRLGPPLPNEQAAREEHFREVGEDVQHERRADQVAKTASGAEARRPWWRFWARRSA
jgi:hypothetical protein